MNKVKKSSYNLIFGLISQIVTVSLGFIVPRLVLVNLGSETNGLLSSIGQILSYLALLEAGVGAASTQALYKPVGKNDRREISKILSATNLYYKRTGLAYAVLLIIAAFTAPFIFKSKLEYNVIWKVVILSGLPNVISYFFNAKYKLLLVAEGKNYVTVNLTTFISICTSMVKIILLSLGFNVIAIQTMYLVFSLFQALYFAFYIKKNYSWIDLKEKPNVSAISQSKNAMLHQISGMIFTHTDVLILSCFCGLKTVSVYSMYTLFFDLIVSLLNTFSGSITFILGQEYNNDRKKFLKLHDAFEICNIALSYSLICVLNIFILPFLKIYTNDVTDISYIDNLLPYLFAATVLLSKARTSSMQVINYAGHFKETQVSAVVEAVVNIVVSISSVKFFGIYGVLIGTICALLWRTNYMIIYSNKKLLNRSAWITYRRWTLNLIVYIGIIVISNQIHLALDNCFILILWAGVYTALICSIFAIANFIAEPKTCKDIARMGFGIIKRKIAR